MPTKASTVLCIASYADALNLTETEFLPFPLIQTPMYQDAEQDQQTQDVHEDSIASRTT